MKSIDHFISERLKINKTTKLYDNNLLKFEDVIERIDNDLYNNYIKGWGIEFLHYTEEAIDMQPSSFNKVYYLKNYNDHTIGFCFVLNIDNMEDKYGDKVAQIILITKNSSKTFRIEYGIGNDYLEIKYGPGESSYTLLFNDKEFTKDDYQSLIDFLNFCYDKDNPHTIDQYLNTYKKELKIK